MEWAVGPFFIFGWRNLSASLSEQVRDLLGPALTKLGYELVHVEYITTRPPLLRLYVDVAAGITLDDCERVSQYVSGLLDVEDPLPGAYRLEVSSPGLDRPLVTAEHFRRFAGNEVRVQLHRMLQGYRRLRGRLCGEADGIVQVEVDGERLNLPLTEIKAARLVPDTGAQTRSKGHGH